MAGFGDVLNQVQDVGGGLVDKWRAWSAQPQNRAMMVQMGLGMMQPISPGQSPFGHFGQALGQGVEAKGRAERQEFAEADTTYKRQQAEAERAAEAADRATKNRLAERQVAVGERNAASLEESRKRTGGLSLNSLFSAGNRDQDRWENFVANAAKAAAENELLYGDPNNPRGIDDFMRDPAWIASQQQAWQAIPKLNAVPTPPPANAGPQPNPQTPSLPAPSVTPQGTPQAQAQSPLPSPQPSAQPIPKPTGVTPKYTEGQIVTTPTGRYKAVIVNGKTSWQRI